MAMVTTMLGESLLARKSEIQNKVKDSNTLYPIEVMGEYQRLKQIRVRIGFPVYRIENGRTRTFQREYIATHPDVPSDIFSSDPESIEAQRAQHLILSKLVKEEDLLKEFQKGTKQTEPIIVTNTGVVVNGNRRLCAWRILFDQDPEKYKYFEFIEIAVLPDGCDEKEIKALEKRLQIQKTHRAEYKWHCEAAMMKEEKQSGVPTDTIAKTYDKSKKEVGLLIGALEYAEIYLTRIEKTDQWSLVDGDEYAFKKMVEERQKITDQGRKELFEAVCFKLIETKDYQGRLYEGIPDIAANLDAIAFELQEKGLIVIPENAKEPDSNTSIDETTDTNDDLDLLTGGTDEGPKVDAFSELATAVEASDVKLGELVKQVSDEQNAIKSEQKNAKYLLNSLSKVSRMLMNILNNGLNENTAIEGTKEQLEVIHNHLKEIEEWLNDR